MSTSTSDVGGTTAVRERKSSAVTPIITGVALTAVFYMVIAASPFQREFLQRYFCSHPLEYATSGLFFVAMAILARKFRQLSSEKSALVWIRRTGFSADSAGQDESSSMPFEKIPASLRGTALARRVTDTLDYLRPRSNGAGFEEHLKYLAEMASERLHESYALIRTITWAIPILGFLGTVIGITIAIANVTPEQLDTSLTEVTGGLAVAFDTTALALALSILLVFASDLLKRSEQGVLVQVEEFAIDRLVPLAGGDASQPRAGSMLLDAEAAAAEMLLAKTEELVQKQTQLWQNGLESMRKRWLQSMSGQTSELQSAVTTALQTTIAAHSDQLDTTKQKFVETVNASLDGFVSRIDGLAADSSARIDRWQEALLTSSTSMAAVMEDMHRQSDRLLELLEQSQELTRIEGQLSSNLEAVRAAETFEQALHNLTAAVHMLTARSKPQAA